MNRYDKTFEWQQFAEGRARFSGGIRGGDERGYDTFAVDIDGDVRYGEIDNIFLPNHNDFNIQVVSFGYGMQGNVGNPHPNARGAYTEAELRIVRTLVVQLVQAGLSFQDRPTVLTEYPNAHFQGKVVFREGWANLRTETTP